MLNKDLIKLLQTLPKDLEVIFWNGDYHSYDTIESAIVCEKRVGDKDEKVIYIDEHFNEDTQ